MTAEPPDRRCDRQTILFYCQSIFGAGHWVRGTALASALARRFRVVLVSGGSLDASLAVPEGVEIESLPTISLDDMGRVMAAEDRAALAAVKSARVEALVGLLGRYRPGVLMVEYFPFDRHGMVDELGAWFAASRELAAPPLIVCSLRDIQETHRARQAAFDARVGELADRYFDAILVHSDPSWIRLGESFAAADRLRPEVVHTGFVVPEWTPRPASGGHPPRVVVSAGGGRGGEDLLLAAVEAQRRCGLAGDFAMRVFAGVGLLEPDWRRLVDAGAGVPGLEILRWTPDLRGELAEAAVSVSRCGYNTALDLLRTRVPALVVPVPTALGDEQTRRASALAGRGLARVLPPELSSPETLAAEIRATAAFRPREAGFDYEGGPRSADWLADRLADRGAGPRRPPRWRLADGSGIPVRPARLPGEFWGIVPYAHEGGDPAGPANLRRCVARARSQGLRLLVVELALGGAPFVVDDGLAERVERFRSGAVLSHRERLVNLGLRGLPDGCDKVAWIDPDLLMEDDAWVARAADRLESHVVVQPYRSACRLLPGQAEAPPGGFPFGEGAGRELPGMAYRMTTAPPDIRPFANAPPFATGCPGLAWAARRDLLERHGLYDAMVLGAGEVFLGHVLFAGQDYWGPNNSHRLMLSRAHFAHLAAWGEPFAREVGGSVGWIPGRALRLWPGPADPRATAERIAPLRELGFDPRSDLEPDGSGCWAWRRGDSELATRVRDEWRGTRGLAGRRAVGTGAGREPAVAGSEAAIS